MAGALLRRLMLCLALAGVWFYLYGECCAAKEVDAKRIFNNNCAKCHGRFGRPTRRGQRLGAPNFSSRFWQVSVTDRQIIQTITYGKNKMPGWRKVLTPEEIRAAARWVRVLGPRKRR